MTTSSHPHPLQCQGKGVPSRALPHPNLGPGEREQS